MFWSLNNNYKTVQNFLRGLLLGNASAQGHLRSASESQGVDKGFVDPATAIKST